MFSISDSSEDFDLEHRGTFNSTVNQIAHQLFAGFRALTQYQSSPGRGRENSGGVNPGPVTSTTTSAQSGNFSRTTAKRKLPQGEEDGNNEDDSCPPPLKKSKADLGKKAQKSFACPYVKKESSEHNACNKYILNRIQDVKLHLIRKHTRERYCQRCHATSFPNEESLQSHIFVGNCSPKDPATLAWISYEQRVELHKKSKRYTSEEGQWFAIWKILFPGYRKPNSVYVDTGLALIVRQIHEYCTNQGASVMTDLIESDPAWLSPDTTGEQRQIIIRRGITEGFNNIFDYLLSHHSLATRSPEYGIVGRMQDSGFETPASSFVDSGVGMGASTSFREPRFRISDLTPMLGNSVGDSTPRILTATASSQGTLALAQSVTSIPFGSNMGDQGISEEVQIDGMETDPHAMFNSQFDTN